jgi:glycosyltransferase involved in cell wall biosynthesis
MIRVVFVLPSRGGGGGAHSVVQESLGLHRLGVQVGIATTTKAQTTFRMNYPELQQSSIAIHAFGDAQELANALQEYDIACATTWDSVHLLAGALLLMGGARPKTAYYVQDYEPFFCTPGTREWHESRKSYSELTDALTFAKTRFLCDVVALNHHRSVRKVSPSIDHDVFFAGARDHREKLVVGAMLRPKTPRRAPRRTARILEMLAANFADQAELASFGCAYEELTSIGIRLSETIHHRGPLGRRDVALVLRSCDLFLDLSDYQAFGRTGLEAMACGCVPVNPILGGATEYTRHWTNGFLVDTRSDAEIMEIVSSYIGLASQVRERMRYAAIETSLNYTIEKAAFSELALFREMLN